MILNINNGYSNINDYLPTFGLNRLTGIVCKV